MNNYFDLRGSRRLSLLCDFVHKVFIKIIDNCDGDGTNKDNGSDGDNRNYKGGGAEQPRQNNQIQSG